MEIEDEFQPKEELIIEDKNGKNLESLQNIVKQIFN